MSKIYYLLVLGSLIVMSCGKEEIPEEEPLAKVFLVFSLDTPEYYTNSMSAKCSAKRKTSETNEYAQRADSIFSTVFKPLIEDGTLLGDSITLTFTNIKDGMSCYINSNQDNPIILKCGTYVVSGTIGVGCCNTGYEDGSAEYLTALQISNDTVNITKQDTPIVLHGTLARSALIIGEETFTWGSPGYEKSSNKIGNYYYLFANNNFHSGYSGTAPRLKIYNTTYNFKIVYNNYYYFGKDVNYTKYIVNMINGFN